MFANLETSYQEVSFVANFATDEERQLFQEQGLSVSLRDGVELVETEQDLLFEAGMEGANTPSVESWN